MFPWETRKVEWILQYSLIEKMSRSKSEVLNRKGIDATGGPSSDGIEELVNLINWTIPCYNQFCYMKFSTSKITFINGFQGDVYHLLDNIQIYMIHPRVY